MTATDRHVFIIYGRDRELVGYLMSAADAEQWAQRLAASEAAWLTAVDLDRTGQEIPEALKYAYGDYSAIHTQGYREIKIQVPAEQSDTFRKGQIYDLDANPASTVVEPAEAEKS